MSRQRAPPPRWWPSCASATSPRVLPEILLTRSDQSAPGGNPYSSNPYSHAESQPLAQNLYSQGGQGGPGGAYPSYPPNSQGGYDQGGGYNAYGQQDQYSSGGAGNGAGGGDFWSQLNNTNALLGDLQQAIQAVRTAHSQTLVSRGRVASKRCLP